MWVLNAQPGSSLAVRSGFKMMFLFLVSTTLVVGCAGAGVPGNPNAWVKLTERCLVSPCLYLREFLRCRLCTNQRAFFRSMAPIILRRGTLRRKNVSVDKYFSPRVVNMHGNMLEVGREHASGYPGHDRYKI